MFPAVAPNKHGVGGVLCLPATMPSNKSVSDAPITQFKNCYILKDHKLQREDLWVREGKILNPEKLFFDEKGFADVQVDCKGSIVAPGFIDTQINGEYVVRPPVFRFPPHSPPRKASALCLTAQRFIEQYSIVPSAHPVVEMTPDLCPLTPAGTRTLCGSIATMDMCVRHLRQAAGCSAEAALEAASLHPAQLLGIEDRKGTLDYGSDADLVLLDEQLNVQATYIAGDLVWEGHGPAGRAGDQEANTPVL
ncbi:N-acetylglucosamine-6-phosphate deacetylase [Mobula birostris]|uniref:N-acetylglucosamine-6-phosphate deacetylase n=1 Tax=Mobula birostris TaxID=1983395 RepID=UPI003B27BCA8